MVIPAGWQLPDEVSGPAPGVAFAGHGARLGAWVLIDERRRGWHDLLAGTCVISAR